MKRNYKLKQWFMACIVVISLLLQSCAHPTKKQKIDNQNSIEEQEEELEQQKSLLLGDLKNIPKELLQEILSYAGTNEILNVRALNSYFHKLITGYDKTHLGLVGLTNKPATSFNSANWVMDHYIDFSWEKFNQLTPETMPTFLFYRLLGEVRDLPVEFWSYLEGTNVHTVGLYGMEVSNLKIAEFRLLARNLQSTSVQWADLRENKIKDSGAIFLAKNLQGTSVNRVFFYGNPISAKTQNLLKEQYPYIEWDFINAGRFGSPVGTNAYKREREELEKVVSKILNEHK